MGEKKKSKSASEVFKGVLKKETTIADEKHAEEVFKGIFTPAGEESEEKVESEVKVEKPVKKEEGDKSEEKQKMKEKGGKDEKTSISAMLKDAYDRGIIDKDKYDYALKKISENSAKIRPRKSSLIADIEFVEKNGRPEVIVEDGEIDIPKTSEIEVVKRDDEISIIVKKKSGTGKTTVEDIKGIMDIERIAEIQDTETEAKDKSPDIDIEDKLEEIESMSLEESGGSSFLIGEMKDELKLNDLRREFKDELKAKKEEEEKGEEEVEEKSRFAFLNFILKFLKKTTEESGPAKLRRLSLENLEKVKEIKDERKAVIGVAYVLKQFLEVRYRIPHELTYLELINDLRNREMDDELRNKLIKFFKRISIMVYANIPSMDKFTAAYNLAEKTIRELT